MRCQAIYSSFIWLCICLGLLPTTALAFAAVLAQEDADQNHFMDAANSHDRKAVLTSKQPFPEKSALQSGGMGWRWPDGQYFNRIPVEAREIPTDWSALPGIQFENTEIGGLREIYLHTTPHYDQWLLHDRANKLYACISVERATRRVYFFEICRGKEGQWRRDPEASDNCYSCHPSGPRVVHTFADSGTDWKMLTAFNRRILSYGACDFWGSNDTRWRGKAWTDRRCMGCHNGTLRGRLYAIHRSTIHFKTALERSMPPHG